MAAPDSPATTVRQRHRIDLATNNVEATNWSAAQVEGTSNRHNIGSAKPGNPCIRRGKLASLCWALFIVVSSLCLLLFSVQLHPVKKHLIFNPLTNLAVRYGYETSDAAKQYLEISLSEFSDGGCRDVILIFARGSGEPGNMGVYVGPALADAAKDHFGIDRVAVEGVNYTALASANLLPGGTAKQGPKEMQRLIRTASSLCPTSTIAVAGYSQGSAVVRRAVESLPPGVRDKISSVVLFADSKIKQEGLVPNYPEERTLQICNVGDEVCYGRLILTLTHLDYARRVSEAVAFIESRAHNIQKSRRAT